MNTIIRIVVRPALVATSIIAPAVGTTTTPGPRVPFVADVKARDGNAFIRRLLGQTKIQSSDGHLIVISLHVDITTRTNNVKGYHNINFLEVLHLVLHLREYLFITTFIIIDIQLLLRIVHTNHDHYKVRVEINSSVEAIAIQVELRIGVDTHPGRPEIGTRRAAIN